MQGFFSVGDRSELSNQLSEDIKSFENIRGKEYKPNFN
jgi:hypothetical protein